MFIGELHPEEFSPPQPVSEYELDLLIAALQESLDQHATEDPASLILSAYNQIAENGPTAFISDALKEMRKEELEGDGQALQRFTVKMITLGHFMAKANAPQTESEVDDQRITEFLEKIRRLFKESPHLLTTADQLLESLKATQTKQ